MTREDQRRKMAADLKAIRQLMKALRDEKAKESTHEPRVSD